MLGASFSAADIAAVLEDDPSAAADSEAWDGSESSSSATRTSRPVSGSATRSSATPRTRALAYRRRRELHGRVADVMERRLGADAFDEAELLSLHFERAGRAAETWKYSIEAGRRAREKWANREAVDFYRRALDVARGVKDLDPAEVARVWEDVGESLRLLGEFEDASRAFAAARRLAPKDRDRSRSA